MAENVFAALDEIIPTVHAQVQAALNKDSGVWTVQVSCFAPGPGKRVLRATDSGLNHDETVRRASVQLGTAYWVEVDRFFKGRP